MHGDERKKAVVLGITLYHSTAGGALACITVLVLGFDPPRDDASWAIWELIGVPEAIKLARDGAHICPAIESSRKRGDFVLDFGNAVQEEGGVLSALVSGLRTLFEH